jgi:hypothetical protein
LGISKTEIFDISCTQHWYCQLWGLTLEQLAAVILLYCGSGLDE